MSNMVCVISAVSGKTWTSVGLMGVGRRGLRRRYYYDTCI